MELTVVILAAGKGKRMVSNLPKVLHTIGARPLLDHVLETAAVLGAQSRLVVYGHGGEAVPLAFSEHTDIVWVEQSQQLGTGHAVAQALPEMTDSGIVLVLYGDVPLVRAETLKPLLETACQGGLGLLTVELSDPSGYGRIVRDVDHRVQRIVEEKDASPDERTICEINTGILAVPVNPLRTWIAALDNNNAQGEYYLTDIIRMAVTQGITVDAVVAQQPQEVRGVNNRQQLAELERCYQAHEVETLMEAGATLLDPSRVDIRGSVITGRDVLIDVNVVFEGKVTLGDRVRIGPHTVIRDSVLGDDTQVLAYSLVEETVVGKGVQIGPYARLRPGAQLADQAKVGNFVEVKKSVIGKGSKVNHLSYIGDAEIGEDVNVGAGTITCNYDGVNKHKTVMEDHVFIGSNTALVAPVRVGEGATVGAGSTIGRDVPAGSLALTRMRQKVVPVWKRPVKNK